MPDEKKNPMTDNRRALFTALSALGGGGAGYLLTRYGLGLKGAGAGMAGAGVGATLGAGAGLWASKEAQKSQEAQKAYKEYLGERLDVADRDIAGDIKEGFKSPTAHGAGALTAALASKGTFSRGMKAADQAYGEGFSGAVEDYAKTKDPRLAKKISSQYSAGATDKMKKSVPTEVRGNPSIQALFKKLGKRGASDPAPLARRLGSGARRAAPWALLAHTLATGAFGGGGEAFDRMSARRELTNYNEGRQ